jgi:hypothetical protein
VPGCGRRARLRPVRPPGQSGQEAKQQDGEDAAPARQHQGVRLETPGRVERSHRADRGQRRDGDGTPHRQDHPADHGGHAVQANRQRDLSPGRPGRAHRRHASRRRVQDLGQSLAYEHGWGHGCQCPEDGERDRLRLDRLLYLVMNDVQAADVEGERAGRHPGHAVHRVFGPGELTLQRRDASSAAAQPHAHPAEPEFPVQIPRRGPGRQEGGVHVVELVHEDQGRIGDRGDLERRIAGGRLGARFQVQPGELVGHPSAHAGAEQPGQPRRQRDLVGGVQARQPARHDGHPVLPEVLTVEAAGHGVGGEGVVHPAVHHRVGRQAEPDAGGQHHWQMPDLPEGGEDRPGDVDEHIAGVDRGQVARRPSPCGAPPPALPAPPCPAARTPVPRPGPGDGCRAWPNARSKRRRSCRRTRMHRA